MVTAMLFAGGVGTRMKTTDKPKQFLEVAGIPIIIRTIGHFEKHSQVDDIVVACKEDWIDYLNDLLRRRRKALAGMERGSVSSETLEEERTLIVQLEQLREEWISWQR